MSLRLPHQGSDLRDYIDLGQLSTIDQPENRTRLRNEDDAQAAAVAYMERDPAARSVTMLTLSADGLLELFAFYADGERDRLWTFGVL